MRGRTLNDAFIIMDEAQNTTIEQMKMFLTRMGNNSKAVITGDITQIDLPNPRKSGLLDAINILDGVEGIHFCHFEECDVVRHALVQRIVRAYESAKPQQQELPLALGEEQLVDLFLIRDGHAKQVFGKAAHFGLDVVAGLPEGGAHLVRRLLADVGLKQHLHGKLAPLAPRAGRSSGAAFLAQPACGAGSPSQSPPPPLRIPCSRP
jgi:hypothetical protein